MPGTRLSSPLADAIAASGLSLGHICRRLRVEKWTLSRWLKGTSRPDESQQLVLGALLNMDLDQVIELVEKTAAPPKQAAA